MTSRFPKALAVVVLVLATALSGCNPFSSSGSEEAASTPGASASAGLDPRYEEGGGMAIDLLREGRTPIGKIVGFALILAGLLVSFPGKRADAKLPDETGPTA